MKSLRPCSLLGILEYYWGEHIHLGYYEEGQRRGPFYGGKDFIQAKYDFIDKMLAFSKVCARLEFKLGDAGHSVEKLGHSTYRPEACANKFWPV
eukprot:6213799-Pleurochrysis_carterae.AAC.13